MKLLTRGGRRTFAVLAASAAILASAAVATPAVAEPAPTERIAGADRFETSALLSELTFAPGAPVAYITTGADFPDALTAGPVAFRQDGPVLLTLPNLLPGAIYDELERLQPQRIVILGGTPSVSAAVETTLNELTEGEVTRVAGGTRFETSALLSKGQFARDTNLVFVTTGSKFPDALAVSSAAGLFNSPILLVSPWEDVATSVAQELVRLNPTTVVILGDEASVPAGIEAQLRQIVPKANFDRTAGADRFETATLISEAAFFNVESIPVVYIANGLNFPDALSAGPVAARDEAPILLVTPDTIPGSVQAELERLKPGRIVVLGGQDNVSDAVEAQLADYVVSAD
jgi:putative cell wall-binding protein